MREGDIHREREREGEGYRERESVSGWRDERGPHYHGGGMCYLQGFSWFIDGTVLTVMTGRDGKTVVKMEPWSRPVPSRRQFHLPLTRTVPSRRENISRCTLPSRPVEEIFPYVPSRQNLPPSRPVYKTYPYRPVPSSKPAHTVLQPSKPVPTVKSRGQNLSLPSRPAIHCRHSFPSRCCDRQDAATVKMP